MPMAPSKRVRVPGPIHRRLASGRREVGGVGGRRSPFRGGLRAGVFAAFGAVLLLVAGVFLLLVLTISTVRGDAGLRRQTYAVQQTDAATERSVIDLETGVRGYLLTGDRVFLKPYFLARVKLARQLPLLASKSTTKSKPSARMWRARVS